MSDVVVRLNVGGVVFDVEKDTLLRFENTYFHGLFSSGAWQPEADGAYFIDRPAIGFDRILQYLRSGKLSFEGLSDSDEDCLYNSLDYFLIPYKRVWHYATQAAIEGFRALLVCELEDGRLCGAYKYDIIVWNVNTCAIDMTLKGHTNHILQVIQLQDGRVCSCSEDRTIKVWSLDSGLFELTLTGHTSDVGCIIQLFDGRICSGSWDSTVKVWNIITCEWEMTLLTQYVVRTIAQLSDGRICCGANKGIISIYSLLTRNCELSWRGDIYSVNAIVRIRSSRICSGSNDGTIKVWSTVTGECERTLKGHTGAVNSMTLLQDGRLCSASDDGTLKLWNLETNECENTLDTKRECHQVLQGEYGRLLCACKNGEVVVWS